MKTLNLKLGLFASALSLSLAACGGGTAHAPAKSGGTNASSPGGFQASQESTFGDAQSAPAPAAPAAEESGPATDAAPAEKSSRAPSAAGAAPTPAPRSEAKRAEAFDAEPESPVGDREARRPGLGTVFGETRTSRVTSSPFERNRPNSPFAVTALNYNDRTGINAMLRGESFDDFRSDGVSAARGMVTVRLIDDNGTPLPTMFSGNRNFVMGENGQAYSIELQNRTGNRFEAVVTVDGLDVIDGRTGSVSKRGYLLQPFATVTIDGFRRSMNEVAAFRFGSVRNSYAGKKGDDRNVGVIGVAFFEERGATFWSEQEVQRRENANPFPGGFAQPPIVR